MIYEAKKQIKDMVLRTIGELVAKGELNDEPIPAFNIEIPADSKNGDMSTNVALVCAKTFKKSPRDIALMIAQNLYLGSGYFERCETAGPG